MKQHKITQHNIITQKQALGGVKPCCTRLPNQVVETFHLCFPPRAVGLPQWIIAWSPHAKHLPSFAQKSRDEHEVVAA